MTALRAINDAIRFLIELCMLAAFAYWGSRVSGSTAVNVLVAIAAPLAAATVWGIWLAPRSERQLSSSCRLPLELILFGLATVALIAADAGTAAIVFAVVAAINTTLVHVTGE